MLHCHDLLACSAATSQHHAPYYSRSHARRAVVDHVLELDAVARLELPELGRVELVRPVRLTQLQLLGLFAVVKVDHQPDGARAASGGQARSGEVTRVTRVARRVGDAGSIAREFDQFRVGVGVGV
eukprot:7382000-Prymnesium_polylepis.1